MPSGVGLPLTSIGILDGKAHRSAAHSRASQKDATFVMAPVIAVLETRRIKLSKFSARTQ